MKEKKQTWGLSAKLITSILLLSVILCGVISYVGYRRFTSVLEHQYNDAAYEVAETAKSYINADKLDHYLETQEVDEEFLEIQAKLDELVVTTNCTVIYVTKVDTKDYLTSTYIYDSVHPSTGFDRYPLGYTATDMDAQYVQNIKQVMTTGERVTEYCYSYSKESGAHTTAGAAVYNSAGEIIAFLGVEKPMTALENARRSYVYMVMAITVAAVALFLIIYIAFLRKTLVKPVLAITGEAERFARSSEAKPEVLQQIKNKDEIGMLAWALGKMEVDIIQYTENLAKVTADKERIATELNVATEIQASMLPSIFPAFPDRKEFDIHASMTPAKEVGGDFYDFFLIDEDHLAMVIADVSGKGVPAALFMMISKTLLKNAAQMGLSPKEVLEKVNNQLCENNDAEMFVTVWLGIMEISTGRMCCANAGHEYPAIRRKDGSFELFKDRHGLVLAGMEGARYREYELVLEEGDTIFVYTDGVAEATDAQNELYGTNRMLQALNQETDLTCEEILLNVKADIDRFAGEAPQFDDITMLCLERKGR